VALAPLWFIGVEGPEEAGLEMVGVWGVRRLDAGLGRLWREGVRGNATEFLRSVAALDVGVIEKGKAKSGAAALRLTGDFVGDREGDDGGTNADTDNPLGDTDANVRVNEEVFGAEVSCGISARGILGIGLTSLCS